METNNNKRSNECNEKRLTKIIKKYNFEYSTINPKEKEMLLFAIDLYDEKVKELQFKIKEINKIKLDVKSFCEAYGISRMSLYRKDCNGNNKYSMIVSIINAFSSELNAKKTSTIKAILSSTDEDYKLLNDLLIQQVEYEELKKA